MSQRILITGSSGLVGRALCRDLAAQGVDVICFDIAASDCDYGDITNVAHVRRAIKSCDGVIHLGAVSRVIMGERDPERCWSVNVGGLQNLLEAITEQATDKQVHNGQARTTPFRPWLVFASSREVYGQQANLPVSEDAPLRPVNIYGRSKVACEQMVQAAADNGLPAAIVRLSNVYGNVTDHADRVVPAFIRAAVTGMPLRVEGKRHTFDFTHVDDVSRGIVSLVNRLAGNTTLPCSVPTIQFVTNRPTTLGALASSIIKLAESPSSINQAPPRNFDVARFYGSPIRARSLLGWTPQVSLETGLARLIHEMREVLIDEGICPPARIPASSSLTDNTWTGSMSSGRDPADKDRTTGIVDK